MARNGRNGSTSAEGTGGNGRAAAAAGHRETLGPEGLPSERWELRPCRSASVPVGYQELSPLRSFYHVIPPDFSVHIVVDTIAYN